MLSYFRVCGYLLLPIICFTCREATTEADAAAPPNVIVILVDDLGYGDLGSYGSHRINSPWLDRMAAEGLKLTNFYAFPTCSPSRAALLTGCYPPRVGIPKVVAPLGPEWTENRQYGLNPAETTLPELLRAAGYATGMVGKWHLGHFPETMPLNQGFDFFYGLPYSNDMLPEQGYPDLVLFNGEDTAAVNPEQSLLTEWFTQKAVEFIRQDHGQPFFLYLAHSMPHVPIFASDPFVQHSGQGDYADVVEELDASVGRVLTELKAQGVDDNTLVVFTSDNGPWLTYGNHAGNAGPFREGKGTTWEGGMRVPMIVRWPATIPAGGVSHTVASLIDILPTVSALTGAGLPEATIDGRDLTPLFTAASHPAPAPKNLPFCYYRSGELEAVRVGKWKLHLPHDYRYVQQVGNDAVRGSYANRATELALYDLQGDPGERYNIADEHPEKVEELRTIAEGLRTEMVAEKRPPFRPRPASAQPAMR